MSPSSLSSNLHLLRVASSSLASSSHSRRHSRRYFDGSKVKSRNKEEDNVNDDLLDAYKIPSTTVLSLPGNDKIEIRLIDPYTIAITPYENREEGLSRLLMYIEGENESGQRYPPTQPLTMRYALDSDGEIVGKTMELYLGPKVNPETNPAAKTTENTKTISAKVAGGELIAVMPLVGMATEDAVRRCRDIIAEEVEKTKAFELDGAGFRVSTFGPMYSLRPRDNEVSVKVTPKIKESSK